tara:strand:- start:98 stop:328 length:231 start_codon:yes stop_codon:yes gene_type:complete
VQEEQEQQQVLQEVQQHMLAEVEEQVLEDHLYLVPEELVVVDREIRAVEVEPMEQPTLVVVAVVDNYPDLMVVVEL